tara:strand:- start:87 stop:842 length:756 start_codon:yes stop_codon:yes gene_type:complete
MMRTANPALNDKTFGDFGGYQTQERSDLMSLQGTVFKTGFLLVILVAAGAFTWAKTSQAQSMEPVMPWMFGGLIGGLVFALITIFKPTASPYTAPIYAACEGLFLGAISAMFEMKYPGIVVQAVGLTFGTLGALLAAYTSGLIKPTENFKLGIVAATGGIMLLYVVSMVMNMFGGAGIGFIHSSGPFGIAFSAFVVIIAALNLVLDFDFIENGVERGAPKHMEWYAAFGLLVTLVWLYIEILRLLSKLRER